MPSRRAKDKAIGTRFKAAGGHVRRAGARIAAHLTTRRIQSFQIAAPFARREGMAPLTSALP